VFGDRQRDAGDIAFLECILADELLGNLPGDRHDGDRIELGGCQTGHQIGGAGTRGSDADADLSGGARIPVGRQGGPLLEAGQHMVETGFRQRIVERNHGAARIAKDDLDPFGFERLADDFGPGELYGLDRLDLTLVPIRQGWPCCFDRCHARCSFPRTKIAVISCIKTASRFAWEAVRSLFGSF